MIYTTLVSPTPSKQRCMSCLSGADFLLTPDKALYLVPIGGEEQQKAVLKIPASEVRDALSTYTRFLNIKMMDGYKKLGKVKIPWSDFKFSFHTKEFLDQKGKCCYAARLGSLYKQGIMSEQFYYFVRGKIAEYCVLPN